ncbi:MAG: hypothetical protein KAR56_01530, partial [Thermoplasmata archaeon]|nr:hypothetical protein [Thermoplasmata archaeon]
VATAGVEGRGMRPVEKMSVVPKVFKNFIFLNYGVKNPGYSSPVFSSKNFRCKANTIKTFKEGEQLPGI